MDFVVLDTDVASSYLRESLPANVIAALAPPRRGLLTFVTVGEMLRGARRVRWGNSSKRNLLNRLPGSSLQLKLLVCYTSRVC